MAPVDPSAQGADQVARVTPRSLVLIGGGEHAGVVFEAIRTMTDAPDVIGFTDLDPAAFIRAWPDGTHLGDDEAGLQRILDLPPDERPALILAIGGAADPTIRRRATEAIERHSPGLEWAVVTHASAWVSPTAVVGAGTVVLAGAVVNAGARIGRQSIVNSRAVVEHDVRIGDFGHIGPGAVIGGGATLGSDVTVGMGALVRDHVVVGDGTTVGMGAVVLGDVEGGTTVVGSPARATTASTAAAGTSA